MKLAAPPGFQVDAASSFSFNAPAMRGEGTGYEVTRSQGKRKQVVGRTFSEDWELRQLARRTAITNSRDLNRNFAVAAFLIRQHVDHVSTFTFQPKSGDSALDGEVSQFIDEWSLPENCDPGARFSLTGLIRLWEVLRLIDGDVLVNRLRNGTIQTIEGDRVQDFGGVPFDDLNIDPSMVVNGVWVDDAYRARGYLVFKRRPRWLGLEFDRLVPATFADLHGYFESRYDQNRGISPLLSGLNTLRDVKEAYELALLKAKVEQIFALAIIRKQSESLGSDDELRDFLQPDSDQAAPSQEPAHGRRTEIPLGEGPQMFDLEPGEDAKVIESDNPSANFKDFNDAAIQVALKSVDMPFSFYNERFTNYSGSRLACIRYENSCAIKRKPTIGLLNKLTRWRLALAVMDGRLKFPKGTDATTYKFTWEHAGVPWYNPKDEVSAAIAEVNAGFSSPQRVCESRGVNFFRMIDERAVAEKYARDRGVVLSTALVSLNADDPNKQQTITEDENEDDDSPTPRPAKGKKNNDENDEDQTDA